MGYRYYGEIGLHIWLGSSIPGTYSIQVQLVACGSTYSTCLGLNCNSPSLFHPLLISSIFYSFHLPSKSSKLTLVGLYCTVHWRILDQVQKLRCRRCSRSCCCWGFRQQHFLFRCQKSRGKLITLPPTLIQ